MGIFWGPGFIIREKIQICLLRIASLIFSTGYVQIVVSSCNLNFNVIFTVEKL